MKKLITTYLTLLIAAAIPAFAADKANIDPQLEQLAKGDWVLQAQALEQLANSKNKDAVKPIHQLVKNQEAHSYVRGRALVALARIDGGKAAGDAQAFAASSDAGLRAAAAEAYGYCEGNAAKTPLGNLLKDKDEKVAMAAVVSWARLYGKDAWAVVDSVTKPLVHPRLPGDLQWKLFPGVQALAHTGTPDAHERIKAIAKYFLEPSVRGLVASGKLSDLTMAARLSFNIPLELKGERKRYHGRGPEIGKSTEYRGVLSAIQEQGPETVKIVVSTLLESRDAKDLVLACTLAAHMIPAPETGDILLKACGDADNQDVDHACVQALTVPAMQPERYQAYFTRLLKSKHASSRIAGIDGLAACPKVNRYEAYSDILQGEDSNEVLQVVLEQLMSAPLEQAPRQKIGTYLYKAMAAKDSKVRNAAAVLFKRVAAERDYAEVATAWETLLHSKDLGVRSSARKTIAMIATEEDRGKLARSDGYITDWQVLGTFIAGETIEKTPVYPPEAELDFSKTYQAEGIYLKKHKNNKIKPTEEKRARTIEWLKGNVPTVDGFLPVHFFVSPPRKEVVAYAAATFTSKSIEAVTIAIDSIDGQSLWVNGALVVPKRYKGNTSLYLWPQEFPWHLHKGGTICVRDVYKVVLKEGPNQILVKTLNTKYKSWDFRVRMLDEDGSPVEVVGEGE